MKLKEFIDNLNEFAKANPDALNLPVYSAVDDEGNGYNSICYKPSKGYMEDGYSTKSDHFKELDFEYEVNGVVIN